MWIRDRKETGKVVEMTGSRSYSVQTEQGLYQRNRQHLIHLPEEYSDAGPENPSSDAGETLGHSPRRSERNADNQPRRSERNTRKPDYYVTLDKGRCSVILTIIHNLTTSFITSSHMMSCHVDIIIELDKSHLLTSHLIDLQWHPASYLHSQFTSSSNFCTYKINNLHGGRAGLGTGVGLHMRNI